MSAKFNIEDQLTLPLLARSAWLEGEELVILDETRLPWEKSFLRVKDPQGAVAAIKEMKTRAFGQVLVTLYALVLAARQAARLPQEEQLEAFWEQAEKLANPRPTVDFKELIAPVLKMAQDAQCQKKPLDKAIEAGVQGLIDFIQSRRIARCQKAADLIKDGDTVLTHCNVSGEMVIIGELCRKQGKRVSFFATETRPYLQGARLTAWELKEAGFEVTLIPDNAVAKVMTEGKVSLVIVGSDRTAQNGDVANKIGTYQIALVAKEFGIPFYVLAQPSKRTATGADIPIEERDPREVLFFEGQRIAPEGIDAYYPGFDVTPKELISGHLVVERN